MNKNLQCLVAPGRSPWIHLVPSRMHSLTQVISLSHSTKHSSWSSSHLAVQIKFNSGTLSKLDKYLFKTNPVSDGDLLALSQRIRSSRFTSCSVKFSFSVKILGFYQGYKWYQSLPYHFLTDGLPFDFQILTASTDVSFPVIKFNHQNKTYRGLSISPYWHRKAYPVFNNPIQS